ncbi:unnamed protein product [Rotaria socialis]|uniref:Aldos-2-ulose dehydratase beta-propeller domain-containing protein n=2 Tax=Rotaria socialis TaxID=392032 RepID=A0A820HZU9_9BILA|nr:unnamed protein product [Rotaria socialis]
MNQEDISGDELSDIVICFRYVPVLLCQQPDNVFNATEWSCKMINQEFFHAIHDATIFNDGQLDNLLIASYEGINWLYFNPESEQWKIEHVGDGEQEKIPQAIYWCNGDIDVGRIENEPLPYMVAIKPFHGNVISAYVKNTKNSLKNIQWKRYTLDVYGYPNDNGESSAHYIACGDFDKDGDDEFLVAL